jgi:hypothetical protein
MPISTTLRRLDGGIFINADGIRTDQHGIPLTTSGSGGATTITSTGVSPEGVVTADAGNFVFDNVANTFWVKSTGSGNTGWLQLI